MQLITSNFYSILYYNSEIWHIQSLKCNLKQKILSSSAKAIKTCVKFKTNDLSYVRLHEMFNRATPEKFLLYKHALGLHKLYRSTDYSLEWTALNLNQILTSRQTKFITSRAHKRKVGLNAFSNRLFVLNDKIPLDTLNKSFESFKIYCKKLFLI